MGGGPSDCRPSPRLLTQLQRSPGDLAAKSRALARCLLNLYVEAVVRLPMLLLTGLQRAELVADADRIRAVIAC